MGLFLFATAIVCQLESELGLSPWDTLHQGIAKHTPLTFGEANIVVGMIVVAVAWALGARIWIGTIANAVLVGVFIQGLTAIGWVDGLSEDSLAIRITLLVVAMPLYGIASALYLGAWFGAGPRDSLMLVGSRRTGVRVGVVRAVIEVAALAVGIALGGTFGIGTIAFAFLVGPVVESSFALLARSPLAMPSPAPVPVVIGE